MSADDKNDRWLTIILAEFNALRAEILQHIQLQQVFLGLTVTALGGLLSVALTGPVSRAPLLLAIPFITSAFAFAFFDHARHVEQIGRYIRETLWRDLRALSTDELACWEDEFDTILVRRSPFQASLSSAYLATLFVLSPVAADLYVAITLHWRLSTGEWLILAAGAANVVVCCAFGLAVAFRYGRSAPKDIQVRAT